MPDLKRKEVEARRLKTKIVYNFIDPEAGVNVKSKEVFIRSKKVVHYPFNTRTGNSKYDSIKKITYEDMPDTLPAGFIKAPTRGYGFTRELSPILYKLQDEFPKLQHIIVSGTQDTHMKNKREIVLSQKHLKKIRPRISVTQTRHRDEISLIANNELSMILPDHFSSEKAKHTKGQLAEFISNRFILPSALSTEDINAITDVISNLPGDHPFVQKREILTTKASVDKLLIEDLIREYEKLLNQKTRSKRLEAKWQDFFSDNILYFNFGYVRRFEKEAVQGDKKLNIPDFILLNTFYYLDFFEIKTHLTQLLSYDKGRNNFYWTTDASKSITQVENYIDALIKEEDTVIKNIRDEYGVAVDAVRPYAYIIASSKDNIAGKNTRN